MEKGENYENLEQIYAGNACNVNEVCKEQELAYFGERKHLGCHVKTKEETKKYTHDEAINNAKESIKTEILKKTSSNSQILDQKVLKESEFDSKIELEVFVSVLENISKREYFEESDINDTN